MHIIDVYLFVLAVCVSLLVVFCILNFVLYIYIYVLFFLSLFFVGRGKKWRREGRHQCGLSIFQIYKQIFPSVKSFIYSLQ